jgi:hypothetical protein
MMTVPALAICRKLLGMPQNPAGTALAKASRTNIKLLVGNSLRNTQMMARRLL